jgi:hypothetical protein
MRWTNMRWKKRLSTLAGLSIAGVASGMWLGGAAIGEIDPFFFSEPETSFVSDRMAYQSPDWAEVQIGEYQKEGLLEGIGPGPMPGAVYASPAVASYGESWTAATIEESVPVRVWTGREQWAEAELPARARRAEEAPAERSDLDAGLRRVERYASYATSDEASQPEAEGDDVEPEVYAAAQEIGSE